MVRRQIAGRGIADRRVLAAMEKVPREAFLAEAMQEFAYEDTPLPIEEGQTMSQPYIVARMVEAADVGASDRVLEIGAGSGYAAAVLGELAGRVFTIERHPALAELARARLRIAWEMLGQVAERLDLLPLAARGHVADALSALAQAKALLEERHAAKEKEDGFGY